MSRNRDRSRRHDVILWGATGFTGQLVAEYLAERLTKNGLRLALDGADLHSPGGVLTPASAMGMRLVDRLRQAGMVFEVAWSPSSMRTLA